MQSIEDLAFWLRDKPPELSAALTSRIGLRILPIATAGNNSLVVRGTTCRLALPIFRAAVISRVARNYPNREFCASNIVAANDAARSAAFATSTKAAFDLHAANNAAFAAGKLGESDMIISSAIDNTHGARDATFAIAFAAEDSSRAGRSTLFYGSAIRPAFKAAEDVNKADGIDGLIREIRKDCSNWTGQAESIETILALPLWSDEAGSPWAHLWEEFRREEGNVRHWSNWITWYERRLNGDSSEWGLPQFGELEMTRRLIEAEENFWKRGEDDPAWLNAEIGKWLDELREIEFKQSAGPVRIDYFISYSKPDEAMARDLVEVIEAAGHSTFAMFKDIPDGSNFVHEMNQGLAASRQFVGLYSKAYFESKHCRAELAHAYNRDPDGELRFARAVLLESCELPPLAQQVIYRSLIGLSGAERKQAILEMAGYAPQRDTPEQTAVFAAEIASPKPRLTEAGRIGMSPNPDYDEPAVPQDMLEPLRQMLLLLRALVPALELNVPLIMRSNLCIYFDELKEHRQHASWGALDRLMRHAETTYRATDIREFDPGTTGQFEDVFALHGQLSAAMRNADRRFNRLADTKVYEAASGPAISVPVGALADAARLLRDGELTEPSFDRGMAELIRQGRDQEFPPPSVQLIEPRVPKLSEEFGSLEELRNVPVKAVSALKAWIIGALGVAKETWNLLGSTTSIASLPLVKAAIVKLTEAINRLMELLR